MNETPTDDTDQSGDPPNSPPAISVPNGLRFHWITRVGLAYTGILLPLICFAMSIGDSPFSSDWQDGRTKTYAELLITGAAIGPFMPMLLCSMVSMGLLLWRPMHFVNVVWVRFGIYSGILLAAQYCGILGVALDSKPISMIGYSVLATGLLWSFGAISKLCLNPRRPKVRIAYYIVIGLLFLLSLPEYAPFYFFVPLFFCHALGIGGLLAHEHSFVPPRYGPHVAVLIGAVSRRYDLAGRMVRRLATLRDRDARKIYAVAHPAAAALLCGHGRGPRSCTVRGEYVRRKSRWNAHRRQRPASLSESRGVNAAVRGAAMPSASEAHLRFHRPTDCSTAIAPLAG